MREALFLGHMPPDQLTLLSPVWHWTRFANWSKLPQVPLAKDASSHTGQSYTSFYWSKVYQVTLVKVTAIRLLLAKVAPSHTGQATLVKVAPIPTGEGDAKPHLPVL